MLMHRRAALAALALTSAAVSLPALAATRASFSPKTFAAAQAAGKSIIVVVHADWCPTCKRQEPILKSLFDKPQFRDAAIFQVDFDKDREALRLLGVRMQSTLIAYKGAAETGRSVGETDAAALETFVTKAL